MKNNKWCVYKHTSPSGGIYIGITKQNPIVRWNNGFGYKRNPHFYNAIQKYGWNNFQHEIIFSNLTQEEAENYEKIFIAKYKNGGKCYNILDGGLHSIVNTSKKVYQYSLEGKFLKEWNSAVEAAEFYKVSQSTITNCCIPKYRTKTACGFIFSYNKIITQSSVIPISLKPINQYDLNMNLIKTWSSRKEFQKEFPNWRISECLNGKNKSCNNYIFKYVDENNTLEKPIHRGKQIVINGITYQSLKHASYSLKISIYKIKKLLC